MSRDRQHWLEAFLLHLRTERRLSANTRRHYRRDLDELRDWCERAGIVRWRELDTARVRQYAAWCHRRGLGGRSIQRRLSALRTFFNYLLREQAVQHNPGLDVRAPKSGRRLPETLNVDDVERLLAGPAGDPLALRDHAMLELLYSSGLRLGELVSLDLGDLDFVQGMVRVTGKGARTRIIPVGGKAVAALQAWLKERPQAAAETALFTSRRGTRLGPRAVQQRLRQWAQRKGIAGRLHPHVLRHSFASHVLESSGDLRAVQELLGHADISTTQIYTHLDFQHLARVYDAAHPRARKGR